MCVNVSCLCHSARLMLARGVGFLLLAFLQPSESIALLRRPFRDQRAAEEVPTTIVPKAVSASHNVRGYEAKRAVDTSEQSYWLVPGGERMEKMSKDKWIVFDLDEAQPVSAISLLGVVDMFAPARVELQAADSVNGPWRHVTRFRGLTSAKRWQRIEIPGALPERTSRYFRLYIRREGHATFRHKLHGVEFHTDQGSA
jgi:hypothetical protein